MPRARSSSPAPSRARCGRPSSHRELAIPGFASGATALTNSGSCCRRWRELLSWLFILELLLWRLAAGYLSVYFYLKGGVLLTLWWILLLQLRHLIWW